ncbi:Thiamine-monophosphate kinase [Chitinispirillum alkaliphilum]|nr:Thiamine-monophosphate kinase [Chitinispirillum alkaliphilum]
MHPFPSAEYEIIEKIKSALSNSGDNPSYEEMIGDDAAVRVGSDREKLIITADVSVENVHFSTDYMTLEQIAYKAMVSNISDCAAMGAVPDSAVVQLVFPKHQEKTISQIEKIYLGFSKATEKWKFPIVGGDISAGPVWVIAVTLMGRVPQGGRVLKRKGIRPGDRLWVTGVPGRSSAGLAALNYYGPGAVPEMYCSLLEAHISPAPRIEAAVLLASDKRVHAGMDLSDGLSKDVGTLCYENGIGFLFETNYLQHCGEMVKLAEELSRECAEWFYHGGEEYELLFAADETFNPDEKCYKELGLKFISLGRFTPEYNGMMVRDSQNRLQVLTAESYDHCR